MGGGHVVAATFGWLCVETITLLAIAQARWQPPSGGCVLKHDLDRFINAGYVAATFGWLCVETFRLGWSADGILGSHLRVAVC